MWHCLSFSWSRVRVAGSTLLVILAVFVAVYACRHYSVVRSFRNPIAYVMVNDLLYVLEKANNTILQFEYVSPQQLLKLKDATRIEKDDEIYYYMVRKLYAGMNGIVVHSYIYERDTGDFVGYRFREYNSFSKPPREIFTVFLKNPKIYPEISYAFDHEGNHCFVNNCAGQYNIWKIPSSGEVTMVKGNVPAAVQQMGDRNDVFSNWMGICVGPDGRIFISSGAIGQVVEYSREGLRRRKIGTSGFNKGDLLSPNELRFISMKEGELSCLTVASTGNRAWVQYNQAGESVQTVSPLTKGYPFPDILVGPLYMHKATGQVCSFDLVNKCLVSVSRPLTVITNYRTKQTGQVCLLFGAVLCLLILAFFLNQLVFLSAKFKIPFFLKLLILFIPLLVVSALVVGEWVKDVMKTDFEAESIRRSANLARAIINNVSIADLERIQLPTDHKNQAYERIYNTVTKIMDMQKIEGTPKWIIHKIRDGRFYFGINIWRGPIYEPFIVPRERQMFFRVLEKKTCQFGRFSDEQGEWFSYLSPILDAAGNVIYILELYRPTEEIDRADKKATQQVERIVGVTVLIALVLVLLFSYIFTRPLRQLMQATRVVSTGDFSHAIKVRSHDELRDLAGAFNTMVMNLKKYTEDLAKTTAEKERIQSELRFAREVQQSIIPKEFPPFPEATNIEIFARMEPAREVGGDCYDFFLIDKDHMGVVIADVSGKGVPAGLFMMIVRTLMRSNAVNNISASDAVRKTNVLLASDNPSSMFATMFYLVCDMRTGGITYCNAGHNPPVLMRKDSINMLAIQESDSGKGMAIGVMEEAEYSDGEFALAQGESIMLYTDGVTEPVNKENMMYGEERLIKKIETNVQLPNHEICNRIYKDVFQYQQGLEQFDDITVLFFKFLGIDV